MVEFSVEEAKNDLSAAIRAMGYDAGELRFLSIRGPRLNLLEGKFYRISVQIPGVIEGSFKVYSSGLTKGRTTRWEYDPK